MRGNTYGYSGEIDERKTRMWMTSDSNAVVEKHSGQGCVGAE